MRRTGFHLLFSPPSLPSPYSHRDFLPPFLWPGRSPPSFLSDAGENGNGLQFCYSECLAPTHSLSSQPAGNPSWNRKQLLLRVSCGSSLGFGSVMSSPRVGQILPPGQAAPLGGHCQPWLPIQQREPAPICAKSMKTFPMWYGPGMDPARVSSAAFPCTRPSKGCLGAQSLLRTLGTPLKTPLSVSVLWDFLCSCTRSLVQCLVEFMHIPCLLSPK